MVRRWANLPASLQRTSENGPLRHANLIDYRVPVSEDLSEMFTTVFQEDTNRPGPYSAKGAGASGTLCAAPTVGHAIARATGVCLYALPMTPERVWKARREASRGEPRHTLECKKP
jgi:CO/xanthine dehydrogenase Mo-binding subunit